MQDGWKLSLSKITNQNVYERSSRTQEAWRPGENMEDEQIPADGEQEVSADRDANQDDRILFDDEVNSVEMWRCWR